MLFFTYLLEHIERTDRQQYLADSYRWDYGLSLYNERVNHMYRDKDRRISAKCKPNWGCILH